MRGLAYLAPAGETASYFEYVGEAHGLGAAQQLADYQADQKANKFVKQGNNGLFL